MTIFLKLFFETVGRTARGPRDVVTQATQQRDDSLHAAVRGDLQWNSVACGRKDRGKTVQLKLIMTSPRAAWCGWENKPYSARERLSV